MTQTPMFDRHGSPATSAIADLRTRTMEAAHDIAGAPFETWLAANWALWEQFRKLAYQMRMRGRKYYAARTVIEVMRWHYHLHDQTEQDFKLNNDWTPKMARLYNALVGSEFFQTRERA